MNGRLLKPGFIESKGSERGSGVIMMKATSLPNPFFKGSYWRAKEGIIV